MIDIRSARPLLTILAALFLQGTICHGQDLDKTASLPEREKYLINKSSMTVKIGLRGEETSWRPFSIKPRGSNVFTGVLEARICTAGHGCLTRSLRGGDHFQVIFNSRIKSWDVTSMTE